MMNVKAADKVSQMAIARVEGRKDLIKYIIMSIMAGMFVGIGVVASYSIASPFAAAGSPALRLVMGSVFSIALTLVMFTGAELFTGNNMIMTIGMMKGKASLDDTLAVWILSFIGNFVGSLIIAYLMKLSGLIDIDPTNSLLVSATATKMNLPITALIIRGILCNLMVCIAIYTCQRTENDAAKLVIILLCLLAFVGSGFEHSIANMTLLPMGMFASSDPTITMMGLIKNLSFVTLGNMIGGIVFVGFVYGYLGLDKNDSGKAKKTA
ncbi:nitrite transporter NirC [Acetoanaerobium pronyense]|uniref:Nitrite transporter NirC n=1 Tax=Acetoanaerobium pronyense TaxID=1482736 RepID=A0ABS4KGP9_9FIRM|nr:formate/nitrite transporter family protein [Acetoanaerobium pronyense]MBP2026949.1 nitrite transporter NirC [Acetoanaerobium pronyense]